MYILSKESKVFTLMGSYWILMLDISIIYLTNLKIYTGMP